MMDVDDIDDLEYDVMEPIDNDNTHSSPYLNHLVIPIKQIVRQSPQPMIFQTPVKVKKIDYDDILASMNLYVKDGKLHKINRSEGINVAGPKARPTAHNPTPPQPTQEELQKQRNERRKALHLNYLQQQRLRVQIAATKSKQIKFINDSRNIELDSHTTMQFFKMFGK
jgi:hypothetical protein